ncbi:Sperm motility kinase [Colletotrichum siamense]|nr:Sperm motility kinase [Colletotrichum siamense]
MADGNLDEGWTTVHRQFQGHPERLPPAQRELHERTQIKEWESSDGHWSGIGKHPADFTESKKLHHKITVPQDNSLGWGTYGRVEKVTHRTVCLARKWIQPRRGRTIEILREEAHVMERLDHDHIVKLIGTYTFRQRELYLLIWPVAICNLDELLTDLDDLRSGQGDREDITKRLMALGLTDFSAIQGSVRDAASSGSKSKCPLKFLQRIMGCIGQAVTYCHHSNIRHLDLKPTNILLNPERVYLADFGIARDVNDQEKTTTIGHQGTPKWRAPEIYDLKDWSMKSADIYSLGLIYLNIATAVYHGNLSAFYTVLEDLVPRSRAEKLEKFQQQLALHALATQQFHEPTSPTVSPRHILGLTQRMLFLEPGSRPRADQVDHELVDLGGIDQVYHSPCCRKSTRYLSKRIDNRLSATHRENVSLKAEVERLKRENAGLVGMDETYNMRLVNQERSHARHIESLTKSLTKQLEEEREKRRKAEGKMAQAQMDMQARRHSRSGLPRVEATQQIRSTNTPEIGSGLGIRMRPQTHPMPQTAVRPPPVSAPSAAPSRPAVVTRIPSEQAKAWVIRNAAVMSSGIPTPARTTDSPSPNPQTPPASALPSRSSASRLPILAKIPATPRTSTPTLARDPSLTASTQASMSSSIFSRRSFDTTTEAAPTPPAVSPVIKKDTFDMTVREVPAPPTSNDEAPSPVLSIPPSFSSVLSSPRTATVDLASVAGSEVSQEGLAAINS